MIPSSKEHNSAKEKCQLEGNYIVSFDILNTVRVTTAFQKTEFKNEHFKSKLSVDSNFFRFFFDFSVNPNWKLCDVKYKHGYSDSKII